MGQNIDQVDDNEYMAVTEAMAVFGEEIEQRGSRTWLGISWPRTAARSQPWAAESAPRHWIASKPCSPSSV